jgi:glycosyltransferase involved in cell wall biosynthesis
MKKILHIQVLPKLSGVQNISYEVLRALPAEEYDKYILFSSEGTTGDKEFLEQQFNSIGVKVFYSDNLVRELDAKKDFMAFKEIKSLCKKQKFDIVHTNSSKPGVVGRIAARLAGVPLVVHTVHGIAFHKFEKFPKWQFYYLCEIFSSLFCHRIVLVNRYYQKYFFLFKKKTSTIYNAIDYKKFKGIEKLQNKDGKIRVLFVGRLDAQKNPISLLKIAKLVIEKNKEVIFTLVGDGELMNDCQHFVTENNLIQNVILAGWQNNPGKFYSEADIFAATSIYEAFGLMFLEAGYFHLPICATNVEGVPEVITEGVSGFLCEPNDEKAFADRILKLCNDEQLRVKMGDEAFKRSTEVFNIERMAAEYRNLYEG